MKRLVEYGQSQGTLEWGGEGGDLRFSFQRNGDEKRESSASLAEVEPGIYSVLSEGRSYEVKIVRSPDGWAVDVNGRHMVLNVVDPREWGRRRAVAAHDGPVRLSVPMPGKVVRVLACEGDEVAAGQGLIVVEAMKMQNEVKAPRAGRVKSLPARAGAAVTPGEILAILE